MSSLKRSYGAYSGSSSQQQSQHSSQSSPQQLPSSQSQTQVASSPRAKRRRLAGEQDSLDHLYEDIVTIYVGPNATPFYVYKELVCRDSSFFRAALGGSFAESREQKVSLPEDEVSVFKVYQTWLNAQELRYTFDHEDWWLHLSKLWIFADRMCAYQFSNEIVDAFFKVFFDNTQLDFATPKVVDYVYENTASHSALRRIFVRFYLQLAYRTIDLRSYPQEFLATVLRKLTADKGYEKYFKATQAAIINKDSSHLYHQNCQLYHQNCSRMCCNENKRRFP
ncbi:MAG: hypothetical protein Q9191_005306 [Dirinaria sp. TL-2023a]